MKYCAMCNVHVLSLDKSKNSKIWNRVNTFESTGDVLAK